MYLLFLRLCGRTGVRVRTVTTITTLLCGFATLQVVRPQSASDHVTTLLSQPMSDSLSHAQFREPIRSSCVTHG